ncbi:MAG: DUF4397 domain-containing protein [Flavitalea sp.]
MSKYIFVLLMVAGSVWIGSCKKPLDVVGEYDINSNNTSAYLKFIHASPNFRSIWNTADTLNLFVNNTRLNSTSLSYGAIFPFSVNASTSTISATYAMVPAGAVQIKLSVPGAENSDSFPVLNLDRNLIAGNHYTFLLTDSIQNQRDSSKIFLIDSATAPELPGYYNLRFIHVAATDSVDVFSYARNANIISRVKRNGVTDFLMLSYNAGVPDTIMVRKSVTPAGTGPILAKYPLNAANIGSGSLEKRTFTIYYQGDTSLTGAKAPTVRSYFNF